MPFGMKFFGHRMKDPVDGSLQVEGCDGSRVTGWASAPGITPVRVQVDGAVPGPPPQPGQTLPARVDRADPSRVEIAWDRLPGGQPQRSGITTNVTRNTTTYTLEPGQTGADLPPGVGDEVRSLVDKIVADARAAGATVTTNTSYEVLGAPGRPLPGVPGGGLSPQQSADAARDPAAAGPVPAQATVIAAHEVPVPPGLPGGAPAGTVDLTLDVRMPDGGGFATTTRLNFSTPDRRARITALGTVLPVPVDPNAHDRIVIDTGRMP